MPLTRVDNLPASHGSAKLTGGNVTEQATQRKTITYYVNGEAQTTTQDKLTVREILADAGFTPAEEYRLTRDEGHHVYQDYNEEVPMRGNEKFTATFVGPTPVS